MTDTTAVHIYNGYEQGPIRPPSEAQSLLLRITRNCPWNRCTFCPVYKGSRFSIRPVVHVLRDLDTVAGHVQQLVTLEANSGSPTEQDLRNLMGRLSHAEIRPFRAALTWYLAGMESVFLQDADSLVLQLPSLLTILKHLTTHFPQIRRITTYGRSATIARMTENNLIALATAGLNRIHIGMESGDKGVLARVCKGSNKETHITAGCLVKQAGIELSEYYMPGLGGSEHYQEHALETADALNRINPDFIRLRTLAIPERSPLAQEVRNGHFSKCSDLLVIKEILLFIENLQGVTGYLASDHILNLLPEVEGQLPQDKERMTHVLRTFLELDRQTQILFQLGRRLGIFTRLADLDDPQRLVEAATVAAEFGVTASSIDAITDDIVRKFI
jgi:hypothetical protein